MAYNSIAAEWAAYQAAVLAGDPGTYLEIPAILNAMAAMEGGDATLTDVGLQKSYGAWEPVFDTAPPWIVHIPLDTTILPFDEGAGFGDFSGNRGGETQNGIEVDCFIAGGTYAEDYHVVMARAYSLLVPLQFLYSKNTTLDGKVHLATIHGQATPQDFPLDKVTWRGVGVRVRIDIYYNLPSG